MGIKDILLDLLFNKLFVIMNENIDLTKILKDCPVGTTLYSVDNGYVEFLRVDTEIGIYHILVKIKYTGALDYYTKEGKANNFNDSECCLFPSKDQRDWSKFTAPWYKKEKFDPKILQPFDRVLVRDTDSQNWSCGLFSHIVVFDKICKYNVGEILYTMCIPYNNDTKYLIGTTKEAPKYYKYWEN